MLWNNFCEFGLVSTYRGVAFWPIIAPFYNRSFFLLKLFISGISRFKNISKTSIKSQFPTTALLWWWCLGLSELQLRMEVFFTCSLKNPETIIYFMVLSVFGAVRRCVVRLHIPKSNRRQGNGPTLIWPTLQPTNGIRPKNTTASDRKIVQRADSVPFLGKKFSKMPSDRIENSARWHNLNRFFFTFLLGICQHSAP